MMISTLLNMNCLGLLRLGKNLNAINLFKISSAKYAMQHPIKFMEAQDRWKEKDKVPKHWELIYKAPMERILKYMSLYLTVSTTTVACGGLYYGLFEFSKETMNNPILLGDDVVIANSGIECLVYLSAFFAFHVALKIMLSKYVIRLYQDGDNYIAIFRGHTFNSIVKHKFHLNDFKKLKPTLVVTWGDARFDLGNKHGIVLENYFKTPEYFNYMLYKKSRDDPNKENYK